MSLQVWLPFTDGTLKQQGLKNVEAVIGGNVGLNDNGKLGRCATISASGGGITLPASSMTSFIECTVAFWIKINSWNTSYATFFQAGLSSTAWNNYIFGILRNNTGSNLCFTLTNSSGTSSSATYTTSNLNTAQWYHLAFTYKAGTICIYIDGVLDKTYSTTYVPNFAGITNISIGRGTNNSSYQTNCNLNDFRLYDHCLSSMEVKELAKGLVLHYPLNRQGWGQENLLVDTYNWSTLTNASTVSEGYWYNNGGTAVRGYDNINNITYCKIWHSDSSSWIRYSRQYITMQPNTYYTVSILCRINTGIAHLSIRNDRNEAITFFAQNVELTNKNWEWKFFTAKTHTNTSQEPFTIYAQVNSDGVLSSDTSIDIAMIKLEEGSIATSWCPNSSDTLATTMGLNGTTEYDCSGFCNNGTRTGTFSWTSDTPKYQVSTHIGSTSSKIHTSNFPTSGFGNSYSFAWWGKRASNSPMFWGFSDGIRLNGMYIGTLWNTGDGSNNPLYKIGTTTQVTAPSTGIWHHYVMTGDGTKCYVYLDGELWAEAKSYKAISGTSIYINGWDSGTQYCSDNTDMSDFRIYATALSADDVKSLYQNSAYIDSSGNVYGAVHSEV